MSNLVKETFQMGFELSGLEKIYICDFNLPDQVYGKTTKYNSRKTT